MGFVMILLVVLFAVIGVPIGICLVLSSSIYVVVTGKLPLIIIAQKVSTGVESFLFVAVPLFILAGHIMEESGVTDRLLKVSKAFVGHIAGGLAHVNVVVSMLFAGISGAALADTAAVGGILIPAMKKEGFDAPFSVAITASSSLIGPVIPPSIPMVVFGSIAGVSVGRLFLGGAVPGFLMGLYMMIISYYLALRRGYPRSQRAKLGQLLKSTLGATPALIMPVIIVGGIITGLFTPTESAVIAVVYGLILGGLGLRTLGFKTLIRILNKTAITTSAVMIVVGGATLLGYILTIEGVPRTIISLLKSLSDSPIIIQMLIFFFLIIVGMFMSVNAALIVITPILLGVYCCIGKVPCRA